MSDKNEKNEINIGDYVVYDGSPSLRGYVGCVTSRYYNEAAENMIYVVRWLNLSEDLAKSFGREIEYSANSLIKVHLSPETNFYLSTRCHDKLREVTRYAKFMVGQQVVVTNGPYRGRQARITHVVPLANGLTDYNIEFTYNFGQEPVMRVNGVREEDLVPYDYCRMQLGEADVGQILTVEYMQAVADDIYRKALQRFVDERIDKPDPNALGRSLTDWIMIQVVNSFSKEIAEKHHDIFFDRIKEVAESGVDSLNAVFLPTMVTALKEYIRDNPAEIKKLLADVIKETIKKLNAKDVALALHHNFNFGEFIDDLM